VINLASLEERDLVVTPDRAWRRLLCQAASGAVWRVRALRFLFGWLNKFVPIGDDFSRGYLRCHYQSTSGGNPWLSAAHLFEDIFPRSRAPMCARAPISFLWRQ